MTRRSGLRALAALSCAVLLGCCAGAPKAVPEAIILPGLDAGLSLATRGS